MNRTQDEILIYNALSQVETPDYDIAAAVARRRASKVRPRPCLARRGLVLALVSVVLILSAGAVAAGINGMWGAFFARVPSNAVAAIGVSQAVGDYTLTIEDAIVDENGALLLLTLERADGGEIDPQASLRTNSLDVSLLVDGERLIGSSGFQESRLSEDGKTLYFCWEYQTNGLDTSLLDKTLTFRAEGVGVRLTDQDGSIYIRGDAPVSLASLDFTPDSTSAVTLPVEGPVTISGVELHPTEIRLSALGILVRFNDDMDAAGFLYEDGAAPILTLDDGTVINTQWCGGYDGADGISSIRFCAEDESRNRIFFDTSRIQSVAFGDLGPINLPIS